MAASVLGVRSGSKVPCSVASSHMTASNIGSSYGHLTWRQHFCCKSTALAAVNPDRMR